MNRIGNIIIIFLFSGSVFAQHEINIAVSNKSIETIFDSITAQTNCEFAFEQGDWLRKEVDLFLQKVSLQEALNIISTQFNLEFQYISDNNVLIRKPTEEQSKKTQRKIKGQIVDSETGAPLQYASVVGYPSWKGTYTDTQGNFELIIAQENYEIWVQFLGYRLNKIPITIDQNQLHILLEPQIEYLEDVLICASISPIKAIRNLGIQTELKKQIMTMPSAIQSNDFIGQIQMMPGVSAASGKSGILQVRGGETDESRIELDYIPLYKIDHLYGLTSTIQSGLIDSFDLHRNQFPLRFGGVTSSVLEIHSITNPENTFNGFLDVNLLSSSAYLRIPLGSKKRSNFLISGRTSNGNMVKDQLYNWSNDQYTLLNNGNDEETFEDDQEIEITESSPHFTFQDIHAKWQLCIDSTQHIQLALFHSSDAFKNEFEFTITDEEEEEEGQPQNNNNFTEEYEEQNSSSNTGASLFYNKHWQNNTSLSTALYVSQMEEEQDIRSEKVEYQNEPNPNGNPIPQYRDQTESTLQTIGGWVSINQEFNKGQIQVGTEIKEHWIENEIKIGDLQPFEQNTSAQEISLFSNLDWKPIDLIALNVGIRGTNYTGNGQNYISPRVGVHLTPTKAQHLFIEAGRYHQNVREITNEDRFGRSRSISVLANDENLPTLSVNQLSIGYEFQKNKINFLVEAYYKDKEGTLVLAADKPGFSSQNHPNGESYKLYRGSGISKGLDFMHSYNGNKWSYYLNYTLAKHTERYKEILHNAYVPSSDDRRHQFKSNIRYRWNQWTLSTNYIFASGHPYTDAAALLDNRDRDEIDHVDDLYNYLPDTERVDFSITRDWAIPIGKITTGFTLYNAFDHKNVQYIQYMYARPASPGGKNQIAGTEVNLLGRLWNFNVSLKF